VSSVESLIDQRLRSEIAAAGPIGFDRFMEIALYDPAAGYFAAGRLRSEREGDFLTSPEVSPSFGATVAKFVSMERERIGEPFRLVEIGGGSGSLLRPLLDALDHPVEVVAVERSDAARRAIASAVPEARLGASAIVDRGVIIGNEVLDNMPAAIAIRRSGGWVEERVDVGSDGLLRVEVPARPEVEAWAELHAGPVEEGSRVEVQLEATQWVEAVTTGLDAGAVVLVDYGDTAEGLASRRVDGTIRTYRGHHLGPDPLAEPGATDITMDVNFSAMLAAARRAGAEVDLHRQDDFLRSLGLGEEIERLRRREREAAREGRISDQLRLKSRIVGAETVLHPRGLGDFRVLVARK
jgi:SAM-dependent MidA family methyltransferase